MYLKQSAKVKNMQPRFAIQVLVQCFTMVFGSVKQVTGYQRVA